MLGKFVGQRAINEGGKCFETFAWDSDEFCEDARRFVLKSVSVLVKAVKS